MDQKKDTAGCRELQMAVDAMDVILTYITQLDQAGSEKELEQIFPGLLESLGRYTHSDRSYLFDWISPKQEALRMTHEWCADRVKPTFGQMQQLFVQEIPNWMRHFQNGESVVEEDWEQAKVRMPQEYALFDGEDIHALIVIPILSNKEFHGFIGLDNPEQSRSALSLRLLSAAGGHIGSLKANLRLVAVLEEKQRHLQNSLIEQERQQVKLTEALARVELNNEIVNSISKIYWLIYRMDLIRGTYEEISAGQEMHCLTGKHGKIAEAFRDARETIVAPEHQERMKLFLDIRTLPERLCDTESIAVEYHARSGSWHLARFIVKKRDQAGIATHVLYVVREIDRQKQMEIEYKQKILESAEEARRANMAKTDFLRRMSHDLRTPINGIQGMVEIAEHYPNDLNKQEECRRKVKEASGFLLDLVNRVLEMNKLESGNIVLEHKPFDLFKILLETDRMIEMEGEAFGIRLIADEKKIEHPHLLGSPLHVRQIFQNIVENAVKYNKSGGFIRISCEEIESEQGRADFCFVCEDSGIGMKKSFLPHVFEVFTQENRNARTSYMGTGLGLSITKQLVDMMGGSIEVESWFQKGTRITLRLSFEIDENYKPKDLSQEETCCDDALRGKQVLLAEDNELNMEIACFLLEHVGMTVTKAWNGAEAVQIFHHAPEGMFDVILMDIMMPVMDGLEATRQIRAMKRSDAKTIPILAMTANAFPEDVEQSKQAGMNEHLSKPLKKETVIRAIRNHIK